MTVQQSTTVRNAKLDAFETAIGAAAVIKFFEGAQPANCAAANAGSAVASGTLPSDWMAAASGGTKAKNGTWTLTGQVYASTGKTVAHYRIYASDGTTCHEQGTVTVTGGGGDMTLDNTSVAQDQVVTVTGYTKTAGNA
jgi:hypothetical protein